MPVLVSLQPSRLLQRSLSGLGKGEGERSLTGAGRRARETSVNCREKVGFGAEWGALTGYGKSAGFPRDDFGEENRWSPGIRRKVRGRWDRHDKRLLFSPSFLGASSVHENQMRRLSVYLLAPVARRLIKSFRQF